MKAERAASGRDVVLVLTTAPLDEGRRLADRLLEERLCACANLVGPVVSRYRWQGKIEEGNELLLVLKTRRDRADALMARLRELHSYEVPEALVVPVESGLAAYLSWVADSCE